MTRAEIYAAIPTRGALVDLSARAKWLVRGADRARFLNGQITNDLRKLAPGHALPVCFLTAKGKMCGDAFITAGEDFFRIDAAPALREPLGARIERYLIADDVTIEDVTDEFGLIHQIFPLGACATGNFTTKIRRFFSADDERESVDHFVPRAHFAQKWNELAQEFPPLDEEMCEVLRLEAGVPAWGAELDEQTLPVEAGLDKTAVDFQKGCYVGQEVVSRLKSVGHANRALRGFVADVPLRAGLELFAAGAEKPAAHLTSAAWSFGLEKFAALGYLRRGADSSTLEVRAADGTAQAVAVRELPLMP